MRDYETFQLAMMGARGQGPEDYGDGETGTYADALVSSMALALEEFYKVLKVVGVSAATGDGIPALYEALKGAEREYEEEVRPRLLAKRQQAAAAAASSSADPAVEAERQHGDMTRLMQDLRVSDADENSS